MQRVSTTCPNCRASDPHITAAWECIDHEQVTLTQDIDGHVQPNLLTAPEADAPAPPSPSRDPPAPPDVSPPPSYTPVVADSRSPARSPARSRSPTRSTSPYYMPLYSSPYPGTGAGASTALDSAPPSPVVVPVPIQLDFPREPVFKKTAFSLAQHTPLLTTYGPNCPTADRPCSLTPAPSATSVVTSGQKR